MKLDIQGGELFALKGMQNNLSSCLGLEIEDEFSSLYENQPLFGEVYDYLNNLGFELNILPKLNDDWLIDLIKAGLSLPQASKYLAKKNKLSKNLIYNLYKGLIN